MTQIGLIGIGAGAAAALLFASLASGSPFALVLFYLAPLPILIAGIGWSHMAGLIAALFAAACLAILRDDGYVALVFLATIGLPAWWLGYLALLARPADGVSPDKLEWYPVGRIVLWTALLGAAVVVIAIPFFGTDAQTFHDNVKAGIETALRGHTGGELNQESLYLMVKLAPALVAWLTAMVLFINLWLALRIARVSGQLRRPWPDLSAIRFPRTAPAWLAAALAGIFLPGLLGVLAVAFAAALTAAFVVLGFAVLHVLTRGLSARPFMLAGAYAAVIIFAWPLAIIPALLGLADAAFDLRGRATGAPPTLH